MRYRPDLIYNDHGQRLDLWLPDAAPRAVALFLHGGGFVSGTRDTPAVWKLAKRLCAEGIALASADYRLDATMEDLPPADRVKLARMVEAGQRAGLSVSARLYGPAFAAALFDASDAVMALRTGRVNPAVRGLALCVLGMSAGGIAALSLAHPPSQWTRRLARPDGVVAIASAMVQPWALRPMAPPCVIVHGTLDRVIDPANARLAAAIAERRGVDLRLADTGLPGHNAQLEAFVSGLDPQGRPWLSLLTDLIDEAQMPLPGAEPKELHFAP